MSPQVHPVMETFIAGFFIEQLNLITIVDVLNVQNNGPALWLQRGG